MKSDMKRLLACTSSTIAVALLAFSFAVGGSHAVRADDLESLSPPAQDMVLVPAKDVQALEQRLAYLEEQVAALTESWQHINTHRLCVSDDSSETCITKPQLDAFLADRAQVAQAAPAIVEEAKTPPAEEAVSVNAATEVSQTAEESVTVVAATGNSEPAPGAASSEVAQKDEEPEHTGSITSSGPATAPSVMPAPEILAPETVSPGDQP